MLQFHLLLQEGNCCHSKDIHFKGRKSCERKNICVTRRKFMSQEGHFCYKKELQKDLFHYSKETTVTGRKMILQE